MKPEFNLSLIIRCGFQAVLVAWFVSTGTVHAKVVEEEIKVPVTVTSGSGRVIEQEIVVTLFYEKSQSKPYPVLVLGHGRSADAQERANLGRVRSPLGARWFASVGFMVAVPTRVGYGVTGGYDVEDSGDCFRKNYPPVYTAAAVQTLKVLETVRQRPDVAKERAVIVGQSFGGTTAITVAALNPAGIQAAINFAGGGGGNPKTQPQDPCSPASLKRLFADYGKTARVPTLWIYTENDLYWGPRLPKEWFDAFKAQGGVGEYVLFPPNGDNGHYLFTHSPEIWKPRVLEFLKMNGYSEIKEAKETKGTQGTKETPVQQ